MKTWGVELGSLLALLSPLGPKRIAHRPRFRLPVRLHPMGAPIR
jgi:hypothetical protein